MCNKCLHALNLQLPQLSYLYPQQEGIRSYYIRESYSTSLGWQSSVLRVTLSGGHHQKMMPKTFGTTAISLVLFFSDSEKWNNIIGS
jgi:hypothetical protein